MLIALSESSLIISMVVIKRPQPSWIGCDIQTSIEVEVECYMLVRGTFGFEWVLQTLAIRRLRNSQSQMMQTCFAKMSKRPKEINEQCMPNLKTTTAWLESLSARLQTDLIDLAHWLACYLTVTFLISLCWLERYPASLRYSALSIVLDFDAMGKMPLSTGHCRNGSGSLTVLPMKQTRIFTRALH